MTLSRDATTALEQGWRVLAHQVMQDDPERRGRVIRALALRAGRLAAQGREAGGA
jgi:hypothetical protein